jgi:isopenicillin-N epimerase
VTGLVSDVSTAVAYENPLWGPDWRDVRALWALDPAVRHLNHGSFGAVMRGVTAKQNALRDHVETNTLRFFAAEEQAGVAAGRMAAAEFLGAAPEGLALVRNATTAASTVLAALDLRAGDEVLTTNHTYGAVRMAADRYADRAGATVRCVDVPLGVPRTKITDLVLAGVTDRTRLVMVDHITSPTATVFPVEEIAAALEPAGIPLFVDAAHAPGQLPVDLSATRAAFWTGNFHKWPATPRGTAALYVAPTYRDRIMPLVVSWAEPAGFPQAFDLGGTDDQSAWIVLPDALAAIGSLGWDRLRAHGTALARYGQQVVADALGVTPDALWGEDELWMRCVPLPAGVADTYEKAGEFSRHLARELATEVAVTAWDGRGYVRVSAHAYNAPGEYEDFASGLARILA